MDPFSMVVAIVGIGAAASVARARYGIRRDRHGNEYPIANPEADRMREELKALKERVTVLERIATDNNRSISLDREIEALRTRD